MQFRHVLIPGGAGFIGSNLCRTLINKGIQVTCIDNLSTGKSDNVSCLFNSGLFHFIEADICNGIPETICDNIDCIINLAGIASPKYYYSMPINALLTSVVGTNNLLEYATEKRITLLHASTSEIYGDPAYDILQEEYNGNVSCTGLRSCYDEGKRAAETLCLDYHRKKGTDVRIIRIFNTYGPYMSAHDGRVIPEFINNALNGSNLEINGLGTQTRSFMYVEDLIKAILKYISLPVPVTGPINIGNPNEEHTIKELANIIIRLVGSKSAITFRDALEDDPKKRRPDIQKAVNFLKWGPTVDLETGLLKTIEYFKSKRANACKTENRTN